MKKAFMLVVLATILLLGSCNKEKENSTADYLLVKSQKITGAENLNKWEIGHSISIFDGNAKKEFKVTEASSELYKISGQALENKDAIIGFTPDNLYDASYNAGFLNFSIPEEFNGKEGAVCEGGIPAFAKMEDGILNFRNLTGVLKLSFKGSLRMESFTLTCQENSTLNGKCNLSTETEELIISEGTNSVKINTGIMLSDTPSTYYIPIPAGKYTDLTLEITGENNYKLGYRIPGETSIGKNVLTSVESVFAFNDTENTVIRLDEEGRANCYMISTPGNYLFNAIYKGNSEEMLRDPATVELMWEDVPGFIQSLSMEKDDIKFKTMSTAAANALIAVKNAAGEIIWSWHIWHTGPSVPVTHTYQNHAGARFEVLDRDLGNWSTTDMQTVYYQWGRKDPLPNHTIYDKEGNEIVWTKTVPENLPDNFYGPVPGDKYGYIESSIQHPMAFITWASKPKFKDDWLIEGDDSLWGDPDGATRTETEYGWTGEKTMYDPCPYGYRVASKDTWTGFTTTGDNTGKEDQYNIIGGFNRGWMFKATPEDETGVFYPANGVRFIDDGRLSPTKFLGVCWSSTPVMDKISTLYQYDGGVYPLWQEDGRGWGFAVRCVKEK